MKRIGIIGGSGFIGQHLIGVLANEYNVTALQRNVHAIMPQQANCTIASIDDTDETYDIIINTSYNLNKDIKLMRAQNEAVVKNIQRISHRQTKVIHLSSLAVFGFGLDKPIETKPVALTHDYTYVISKVHMEQCLLNSIPLAQLSIIRLGNVWGPENNSWTQPVAEALQWGLPVLSQTPAYSNITYIHNIGSYIAYMMRSSEFQLFHHLAEFSAVSWQQIIGEMSKRLEVKPTMIKQVPFYATTLADDFKNSLRIHPKTALKNLRDGRFSSAYFPGKLLKQVQFLFKKNTAAKGFRTTAYSPDPTFYWILSCNTEFKSCTLPGWFPPYTWEEVEQTVGDWLQQAGYITEKR